jgi:signal transduction histidine kinase
VTPSDELNDHLKDGVFHIFPMLLRGHQVGVLLVDSNGDSNIARLQSLQSIASQAAVAVGTTMLCIDRAQRLAVQEERIRIAREIHDTVSQSLFGMTYTLDACAKLLPDRPDEVKTELIDVVRLADTARQQLRRSIMDIWPSEMTGDSFTSDLFKYLHEHCRSNVLDLSVEVRGDFELLPARARRDLYRMAQESLTNTVRYAGAAQMTVCLEVGQQDVLLVIRDDGCGFNVPNALARERDREHFGLRGIQERAAALGGSVEFLSQPGAGTAILVELPLYSG